MPLSEAEQRELDELERREREYETSKGGPPPIPGRDDDDEPPRRFKKRTPKKDDNVKPISTLGRVGVGMADPVHGGAQFLTNILPEGVVEAGNRFNNWLADKGVPLARIPEGGVNQMVQDREAEYQARRAAAGSEGVDLARLAGNIASPVNAAVASRIPVVGSLGARMAGGAGGGVALSALNPTTGDYWPEKGKQMAIGGVTGGVLPAVTAGAARVIKPRTNPQVQALRAEGVKMTPGQMLGGWAQRVEDAATSAPVAGDAIKQAQMRGLQTFNRAAINRALKPVGKQLPKSIEAGRDAIDYAINTLDDAYDDLLPKLGGVIDDQFKGDIDTIYAMGQNLGKPQAAQLGRIIKNEIINRFTENGRRATGTVLKDIESKLGGMAKDFARSDNYDVRTMGIAVKELQASLRRMIERANPKYQGQLGNINNGYANLMRVQNAAGRTGAKEGVFTGAQLQAAVRQLDPSKNKRAFARGNAMMQDLSEPAKSVLSQTVPDSGTPMRLLVDNPLTFAWGTAKAIPMWMLYSKPGQWLSEALIARRPQLAAPVSKAIRQASPYLTPGLTAAPNMVDSYGP